MAETVCPRCGFKDSFVKGFLPDTCVCRVCQSQLDWREIPGMGPDCTPAKDAPAADLPEGTPESAGTSGSVGPPPGQASEEPDS